MSTLEHSSQQNGCMCINVCVYVYVLCVHMVCTCCVYVLCVCAVSSVDVHVQCVCASATTSHETFNIMIVMDKQITI